MAVCCASCACDIKFGNILFKYFLKINSDKYFNEIFITLIYCCHVYNLFIIFSFIRVLTNKYSLFFIFRLLNRNVVSVCILPYCEYTSSILVLTRHDINCDYINRCVT